MILLCVEMNTHSRKAHGLQFQVLSSDPWAGQLNKRFVAMILWPIGITR